VNGYVKIVGAAFRVMKIIPANQNVLFGNLALLRKPVITVIVYAWILINMLVHKPGVL